MKKRDRRNRALQLQKLTLESLESRELLNASAAIDFEICGTTRGVVFGGYDASSALSAPSLADALSQEAAALAAKVAASQIGTDATTSGEPTEFFDADKERPRVDGDDNLCWAASTANMLWYTDWASVDGAANEDEFFHTVFHENFPDDGGNQEHGVRWYLTDETYSYFATEPGGRYKDVFETTGDYVFDYMRNVSIEGNKSWAIDLVDRLDSGDAAGLAFGWRYNGSRYGGHAITIWGYSYDSSLDPSDPNYIKSLYVTDSDDYQYVDGEGESKLFSLPVKWSADANTLKIDDADYTGTTYEGWLESVTFLTQRPTSYSETPDATNLYFAASRKEKPIAINGGVAEVLAGDATVDVLIQSTTTLDATASADLRVYLDGKLVSTQTLSGIVAGSNAASTVSLGALRAGWHTVKVELASEVAETNARDNSYSLTFEALASSDTITVTTASDVVDANDGLISLREAIAMTEDLDDAKIIFDPSLNGATITLTQGIIEPVNDVIIDASNLDSLTISGGGTSAIFVCGNYAYDLTLLGLTLRDSYDILYNDCPAVLTNQLFCVDCIFQENASNADGGAVECENGSFERCIFVDNSAEYGGAVSSFGSLYFNYCVFSGNEASEDGGAIYFESFQTIDEATFESSSFVGNKATRGGAIYVEDGMKLYALFSSFSGNEAENGGAVYVNEDSPFYSYYNSFVGNAATENGGGVYGAEDASLYIVYHTGFESNTAVDGAGAYSETKRPYVWNASFIGNEASNSGGGLWSGGGLLTINASFVGNAAVDGAGARLGATGALVNTLFAENVASGNGGALNVAGGTTTLINSTVARNAASAGSAVYLSSGTTAEFENSIVVENGASSFNSLGTKRGYYSLSDASGWTSQSSAKTYDASKPLFVDADAGNYRLARGSQALNSGNSSYISTYYDSYDADYDLAGNARISGTIDLGAYEAPTLPAPSSSTVALSSTATTIRASWRRVTAASGYRLTLGDRTVELDADATSYVFTGLTSLTTYSICLQSLGGGGWLDSEVLTFSARTADAIPLSAPVLSTTTTADSIAVFWEADENATGYELAYAVEESDAFETVALSASTTEYVLSGLAPESAYEFKIRAFGDDENYVDSPYSAVVAEVVGYGDRLAAVAFEAAPTASTILLTWDAQEGAVGYEVVADGTSTLVDADATSFTVVGLKYSTQHELAVRAKGDGTSARTSKWTRATVSTTPLAVVATPEFVALETTDDSVLLSWTPVANAASYTVRYGLEGSESSEWKTKGVVKTSTSVEIGALEEGVYHFEIRANGDGKEWKASSYSAAVYAAKGEAAELFAPKILSTTTTASTATFSWAAVVNASGYEATVDGEVVATLDADATECVVTNLKYDSEYVFAVRALGDGERFKDSPATETTFRTTPLAQLESPEILSVQSTPDYLEPGAITIEWTPVENAASYWVQYALDGSTSWTTQGVSKSTTSFTLSDLSTYDVYRFRVRANGDGKEWKASAYGEIASATVGGVLSSPQASVSSTSSRATIEWSPVPYASGYELVFGEETISIPADATSWTLSGLKYSSSYSFTLQAFGDGANFFDSEVATFAFETTPLTVVATPEIGFVATTEDSITVEWSAVESASSYWVQYAPVGTTNWTRKGVVKTTTSFTLSDLTPGAAYQFHVRANGDAIDWKASPYGEAVAATVGDASRTLIVTSEADAHSDGLQTLREATARASEAERIVFSERLNGATIALSDGALTLDAPITVDASALESLTIDAQGRSRAMTASSDATLIGLTIVGGLANKGGAVYFGGASAIAIVDCAFSANQSYMEGGALYFGSNLRSATLTNCSIASNEASEGGAIYALARNVSLTNCSISSNEASEGGAIYLADGSTTLTNSALFGNVARTGGAIYASSGSATLTNSTLAGNSAELGGGVYDATGKTKLQNAIVSQNYAVANANFSGDYDPLSNMVGLDPHFVVGPIFDATGTLTNVEELDLRLTEGSWAIDRGLNAVVVSVSDFTGSARVVRSWAETATVDLGAYEYQGTYSAPIEEKSLVVTTSADVLDSTDGLISLREAVMYAERGDAITFAASLAGAEIELQGAALLVDKGLTIDASSLWDAESNAPGLTLVGSCARALRITGDATLKGLGFVGFSDEDGGAILWRDATTGGIVACAFRENASTRDGGALFFEGGALSVENATFASNSAAHYGGAIRANQSDLSISDSTFETNLATSEGGAVKTDGGAIAIVDSDFSRNQSCYGGALGVYRPSSMSVVGGSLTENTSSSNGSGIYYKADPSVEATISGVEFSGNASNGDGGAICAHNALLVLTDSVFSGNTAFLSGGALCAFDATVALTDCAISGNKSNGHGGGIYVYGASFSSPTELVLTDCEVSENVSGSSGGGIYSDWVSMTLDNCRVVRNHASSSGGGIYVNWTSSSSPTELVLTGCEVSENVSGSSGGGIYAYYFTTTLDDCRVVGNQASGSGGGIYATGSSSTRLEVSNGEVSSNVAGSSGGGIYAYYVPTTLDGVDVVGNQSSGNGGGIYAYGSSSTRLEVSNGEVSSNVAGSSGGGIYAYYVPTSLTASVVSGNSAVGSYAYGGGVYANYGATTLTSCRVVGNTAVGSSAYGGGIYTSGASTSLTGCVVSENSVVGASYAYGGGIYTTGGYSYDFSATDCEISGNVSGYRGGGVYVGATSTLERVLIVGNTAVYGGGVYAYYPATFVNCAMLSNKASYGGGVYAYDTTRYRNSTIAGNIASYGGGVYVSSYSAYFYNSIVARNRASNGADAYNSGGTYYAYYVLSTFAGWNSSSVGVLQDDASRALFADAANGDYSLAADSQALDMGNNAYAVDASGAALLSDLAGNARIVGDAVDLGAYERQADEDDSVLDAAFASFFDEPFDEF